MDSLVGLVDTSKRVYAALQRLTACKTVHELSLEQLLQWMQRIPCRVSVFPAVCDVGEVRCANGVCVGGGDAIYCSGTAECSDFSDEGSDCNGRE